MYNSDGSMRGVRSMESTSSTRLEIDRDLAVISFCRLSDRWFVAKKYVLYTLSLWG